MNIFYLCRAFSKTIYSSDMHGFYAYLNYRYKFIIFIATELAYKNFLYFLINKKITLFFKLLIQKKIIYYTKPVSFLNEELKKTPFYTQILIYMLHETSAFRYFSKKFFFYSKSIFLTKFKNLIIRRISPILYLHYQIKNLTKPPIGAVFSNKSFVNVMCFFCIYSRTIHQLEYKKNFITLLKTLVIFTVTKNKIKCKKHAQIFTRFLIKTLLKKEKIIKKQWLSNLSNSMTISSALYSSDIIYQKILCSIFFRKKNQSLTNFQEKFFKTKKYVKILKTKNKKKQLQMISDWIATEMIITTYSDKKLIKFLYTHKIKCGKALLVSIFKKKSIKEKITVISFSKNFISSKTIKKNSTKKIKLSGDKKISIYKKCLYKNSKRKQNGVSFFEYNYLMHIILFKKKIIKKIMKLELDLKADNFFFRKMDNRTNKSTKYRQKDISVLLLKSFSICFRDLSIKKNKCKKITPVLKTLYVISIGKTTKRSKQNRKKNEGIKSKMTTIKFTLNSRTSRLCIHLNKKKKEKKSFSKTFLTGISFFCMNTKYSFEKKKLKTGTVTFLLLSIYRKKPKFSAIKFKKKSTQHQYKITVLCEFLIQKTLENTHLNKKKHEIYLKNYQKNNFFLKNLFDFFYFQIDFERKKNIFCNKKKIFIHTINFFKVKKNIFFYFGIIIKYFSKFILGYSNLPATNIIKLFVWIKNSHYFYGIYQIDPSINKHTKKLLLKISNAICKINFSFFNFISKKKTNEKLNL